MIVQFDTESLGQPLNILRRLQADRKYHQVKLLFLDAVIQGRVADGDVLGDRVLLANCDVATDETDIVQFLCALIEALEILAVGADIVMEDGRIQLLVVIFRQNHLFLGVGAADRRAITVAALEHLTRTNALDPGDLLRMGKIGRAQHIPFVGASRANDPLEVETGDHVFH